MALPMKLERQAPAAKKKKERQLTVLRKNINNQRNAVN